MQSDSLPEWERVLSAACRLQRILPEAVLVGGTGAALHAGHRRSHDADHVVTDLRGRFDEVLAQLESAAGWKTARIQRPVQILGSLDGIETGIRQLIRAAPLEVEQTATPAGPVTLPTTAEMLRIKAWLILTRNAARDYIDFAALSDRIGLSSATTALLRLDELYPQDNGESPRQQLMKQLAAPKPYDLVSLDLAEYRDLQPRWRRWENIVEECRKVGTALMDCLAG
jgi:hypothetical protein